MRQKTVFLILTRGFLLRNILRSGVLSQLTNAGIRAIVFLPLYAKDAEIPASLRAEFEGPLVQLIGVKERPLGRVYKLFSHLTKFLVFTQTTWSFCLISVKNDKQRSDRLAYFQKWIYTPLSKLTWLKRLVRAIEFHLFRHRAYGEYFEQYAPDVVFSTSILSTLDILFMKEARRRGVPTVSIPKGWDNVAKFFYRVIPDLFVVQNQHMVEASATLQDVPRDRLRVVGFPQFDWHARKDVLLTREAYCQKMGLDPSRRVILFGSEGKWAPYDYSVAQNIARLIQTDGALAQPAAMLIRPHFTDARDPRLTQYDFGPHVAIDRSMNVSTFLPDMWDPTDDETTLFINTLYHMDALVTTTSTLTLDAACMDKPIINVAYRILFKNGKDVSELFYHKDHYQWVLDTGAVNMVRSDEELRASLNDAMLHPERLAQARERLRNEVCYRVDGKSSERIVDVIQSLIAKRP